MKPSKLWLDSIIAAFVLAFTIVAYILSGTFANDEGFALNPAAYPRLILGFTAVLALTVFIKGTVKALKAASLAAGAKTEEGSSGDGQKSVAKWFNPTIILFVLLCLYAFSLPYAGFPVATIAMLIVGMIVMNYRDYRRIVLISVAVVLTVYFGFAKLLLVKFPMGTFWGGF